MHHLKASYGKTTSVLDLAPIETYIELADFTFNNEATEKLLAAIKYFEPPNENAYFETSTDQGINPQT